MKKAYLLFIAVLIAAGLVAATTSTASAVVVVVVDPETACHSKYGGWTDAHYYDPITQKCYWKIGPPKTNKCWPAYDVLKWDSKLGVYNFVGCGYPPSGDGKILTLKDLFSSGIFNFPGAGKFSPSPTTCSGKCTVKSGLKPPASGYKGSLPGKYKSGAYVQILDQNGNPTEGGFKICLPAKGAKNPQIYKYVGGGNWSLVGGGLTADGKKICTWADTSGNYAVADLGR
jgi:hypothetical protein